MMPALRGIFNRLRGSRNHRYSGTGGKLARGGFRSQTFHRFRRRTDECDLICRAGTRELGIFRKEAVSRMHGVASGTARDVHQLIDAKITFAGWRGDRFRKLHRTAAHAARHGPRR